MIKTTHVEPTCSVSHRTESPELKEFFWAEFLKDLYCQAREVQTYHRQVITQTLGRCALCLKPRADSVHLPKEIKSIAFSPYWQCITVGWRKKWWWSLSYGVKNKFTACIACPSGLACNVTVDPGVEEMETKIKRNKNKLRVNIYSHLQHTKISQWRLREVAFTITQAQINHRFNSADRAHPVESRAHLFRVLFS